MNINWKNAASGRSEAMYTDAKGFRYVLIASVGGDYSVNKLLIKSPHVLPKYSRPVIIGMGWKSDLDEAKKSAEGILEAYIEKHNVSSEPKVKILYSKEEVPVAPVAEPISEEPIHEESPIVEEVAFAITTEEVEGRVLATISYPVDDFKVRYTINGKDVKATNKIYSAPFEVTVGTVVKAMGYGLENNECLNNQIEIEVK